ncbi:DUF115 domain-containing protein [Metallosphaera tengchongensis]|uniref:6-hydroxymethyl-7,8-dihydropterin pyrophosphokinase n=1 Tax=Metallosphaera tengchongensis TaxID=1532350 RepID=A0A6N0NZP4_9CREN|nr:6-hydroxymethylpterin diphosphokinase MptE-like protein [Metallosphaera tengchongensis]QKR00540.1 DUF115 domain-containing protein [Metallosphaera tengchongensis]
MIRREFGFSEREDYRSALVLNMIIREDFEDLLRSKIMGREVAVVGAGPSLNALKDVEEDVIVAADGATNYLVSRGIIPDVVVTDLDGIETYPDSIYVVHAHGDNISKMWKLSYMGIVLGTSQVFPFGRLKLYGGFTDGDRAVVMAMTLGAKRITTYAMDLDSDKIGMYSKPFYKNDVPMNYVKRKKLNVAKEILHTLFRKDL